MTYDEINSANNWSFLLFLTGLVLADDNPLSVRVLNLTAALLSPNIEVNVKKLNGDKWELLNSTTANKNSRNTTLYPARKEIFSGIYKMTSQT